MSLLARQPATAILMFTLITVLANLGSTDARKHRSLHGSNNNNIVRDPFGRNHYPRGGPKSTITLSPEILAKARRTISHLSPGARRFLFSPTIQNTITNLNQNTNTMEMRSGGGSSSGRSRDPEQILGYMNRDTGALEYDLRGKVKKICFILD